MSTNKQLQQTYTNTINTTDLPIVKTSIWSLNIRVTISRNLIYFKHPSNISRLRESLITEQISNKMLTTNKKFTLKINILKQTLQCQNVNFRSALKLFYPFQICPWSSPWVKNKYMYLYNENWFTCTDTQTNYVKLLYSLYNTFPYGSLLEAYKLSIYLLIQFLLLFPIQINEKI